MTRNQFQLLLSKASSDVLTFTREFVWNPLPDNIEYRVRLNQSYDRHPDGTVLTSFPEDSDSNRNPQVLPNEAKVVDLLWRDGAVPAWINVQIEEVHDDRTIVDLICCGRYTADEEQMYYTNWEMGPFGIKGPAIPPEWDSRQREQKFDLYWRKKLAQKGG